MKTAISPLLKIVRSLINIAWYSNLLLFTIALAMLTWKFTTSDFSEFSADINYPLHPEQVKVDALNDDASAIHIIRDRGTLKMNLKNTPENMALAYFFLLAFEALIITIIYQLKRFFGTLQKSEPFAFENIRRLKIIALSFVLLNVLHILLAISTSMIIKEYVSGYDKIFMVWIENFYGFIWGAGLYILADIFKYGFTLKKENEEFV